MINLIKNEFIKIISRTSFLVLLLLITAFIILYSVMFQNMETTYMTYEEEYNNQDTINNELNKLEEVGKKNTEEYAYLKTDTEILQVRKSYGKEEWKRLYINQDLISLLNEINISIYVDGIKEENSKELKELLQEKEMFIKKLQENDWAYFYNRNIKTLKSNIEMVKSQLLIEKSQDKIKELNTNLKTYQSFLNEYEYRLNNNVGPDSGFLDEAVSELNNADIMIYAYENSVIKAKDEIEEYQNKKEYYDNIEKYNVNKYIIDNNVDADSLNDTKHLLKNIFNNYGLFIIIVVLIYASSIVSEEFNKGTIKLLLIRPHSRAKILISKFITVALLIPIIIIFVVFVQLIVGGILYGFDSLQNPIVVYDHNQNSILVMNVFKHIAIETIYMLPLLLLLTVIAFAASTIITNTALALAGTLLLYMGGTLINTISQYYNIETIKYFITMNWEIKQYIFGRLPETEFTTLPFSLAICVIYFVTIMILTITNFKRKNIKNI